MFSLGTSSGKAVKPSFVSYVSQEDKKTDGTGKKDPDFLHGEEVFCSAYPVVKLNQDGSDSTGSLLCTNFRISFVSSAASQEEATQLFRNKLYGENDIPLTFVDQIYGDDKRKLGSGAPMRNKYPSKIVIHCRDLRVFQFSLTLCKEDVAKKIVQGIVHHSLEPKSQKCLFAFSYGTKRISAPEMQRKSRTAMFDNIEDWKEEMKRTKGHCSLIEENETFDISQRLPQFFYVPTNIYKEDLREFQGKGIPVWCWSHHSGCGLFKASTLPLTQDEGIPKDTKAYIEKILNAVAQNHLYTVKIEELSETLPSIQDIQQSYSKFKQNFLTEGDSEFWESDVKWFSVLEMSGWQDIIRQCLHKAVEVVECLERENTNVLLREEEGSDLCCVISSLVQLMLDPHCRTLTGFQSLLQKEWIAGGHNFLDRGNLLQNKDSKLQSPVFLLFLECVWQLHWQHSPAFQFSETYLTVLSDSIHVAIFSTFIFSSPYQKASALRAETPTDCGGPLSFPTVWDWSLQFDCKAQEFFINPLFTNKSRQDKVPRRTARPKHQRQLSLPGTAMKSPQKKGFFKEETDNLRKMLRGKRISRWMLFSDSTQASTREFYDAWNSRPLDYHGLLLPCLEGHAMRLWRQRYLRWTPQAQIFGGGVIALTSRLAALQQEVQELQLEIERREYRKGSFRQRAMDVDRTNTRLSSSFPFTVACTRLSKPVIPTNLFESMNIGELAGTHNEYNDDL